MRLYRREDSITMGEEGGARIQVWSGAFDRQARFHLSPNKISASPSIAASYPRGESRLAPTKIYYQVRVATYRGNTGLMNGRKSTLWYVSPDLYVLPHNGRVGVEKKGDRSVHPIFDNRSLGINRIRRTPEFAPICSLPRNLSPTVLRLDNSTSE